MSVIKIPNKTLENTSKNGRELRREIFTAVTMNIALLGCDAVICQTIRHHILYDGSRSELYFFFGTLD
jgi:hypothetical protein